MRVYFGVCGIGLGHIGRCIPIAKELQKKGNQILFSTYKDAFDLVKRENLPLCKAPPIYFAVRPDGGVDFRKTTANPGIFAVYIFFTQINAEIEFMRGFNPDFVISDSRISSLVAAKLLGIPAITLLNLYKVTIPRERRFLTLARIADGGVLTIVGKAWSLGRKILIPDFPLPYTLSLVNLEIPPRRRKKIMFVGPILPIRPDELPEKKELRKNLGLDDKPLIFIPISGSANAKKHLIFQLKQILNKLPKNYNVVMSLGQAYSSDKPVKEENITIYPWITNRFEYLKACDLVISRAGLGTLSQAICYGKPLIIVPTPSQTEQKNNAARAQDLGVAKVLKQSELNYENFVSAIQEITKTNKYLKKAEEIKFRVSKYNALETMIKIIANSRKNL